LFKDKFIKERKNLFFRVSLRCREQAEFRKDFPGATSVQKAIWGQNHSNSVRAGLKMHIGSDQQRIWWGPHRVGRNARAKKLQGSERSEGQAEKNAAYIKKQQDLSYAWTRSTGGCGGHVNPMVSSSTFECCCGPGGTC